MGPQGLCFINLGVVKIPARRFQREEVKCLVYI
ncbi:hypothetical protein SNOG_06119 [Parastagonospora nodorum SN15]|uniref:Uncharacterized protein n=1 Tax=Phaeosphaeria nodorum (strain SN15 / ATCC MYA-4574 / FGSC 10173) TaxID=321614 RepID=Q0UQ45_PHANO|nr:hypothetical protein SNOG_06119 [Parastagonospora nodorum SN15]EAT85950.1 hypothetical protein SNOG_06119 [Parastagonospora nodorum SN15]